MIKIRNILILLISGIFAGSCAQFQSSFSTTSHNAGTACMAGGCHAAGSEKAFTVSGTVYTDATGVSTAGGLNVTVTAGGLSMEVDKSGNFYSNSQVNLGSGATTSTGQKMAGSVTTGDCNKSGCHDTARRIFK